MRHTEPTRLVDLGHEICEPQASPDLWPPCRVACPVGTDARGYLEAIAYGRYDEAFRIARQPNPIVTVCAHICHHPCEQKCRRNEVDEPLSIRGLKRFAVERGRPRAAERARELAALRGEPTHKKVAIVGSGPAGLACAEKLLLEGHDVSLFERRPSAGGQLANTIPLYRLPREGLAKDVADIEALGAEIRTGVEVGRDVTLAQLTTDFDAVVLAIGLSSSRGLPLEGMDHETVMLALPFLEDCARNGAAGVVDRVKDRDVIVIGGGNVAIDVARSAMRLGPKSVRMVCLEAPHEMPAWDWEVAEAAEEGIEISCSLGPKRIVVEDGACKGLETKAVKCVFDEQGRFAPEYFEDKISVVAGDAVIVAIGQMADYVSLEGSEVAVDERGRLQFDPHRMATNVRGVFASGEVVTGPGSAIDAAASGRFAASAVMDYLAGGPGFAHPEMRTDIAELPERVAELVPRVPRQLIPHHPPEERKKDFALFEHGFDETTALIESRRCMLCGAGAVVSAARCCTCVTCERVCPFGVPSIKEAGWAPASTCQGCGVCAVECPAGAIDMNAIDAWEAHDAVAAALTGRGEAAGLLLACSYHLTSMTKPVQVPPDWVVATVSCAGRVRVEDVLKGYELGAKKVVVSICGPQDEPDCRNRDAGVRAEQRLGRVAQLLPQMGLDFEAFEVVRR